MFTSALYLYFAAKFFLWKKLQLHIFWKQDIFNHKILQVDYFNNNLNRWKRRVFLRGWVSLQEYLNFTLFYLNMQAICPILNHTQPLSLIVDSLALIFMSKSKLEKRMTTTLISHFLVRRWNYLQRLKLLSVTCRCFQVKVKVIRIRVHLTFYCRPQA